MGPSILLEPACVRALRVSGPKSFRTRTENEMNRDQKEAAVKEICSELEAASAVFAVDYRGISVPQAAELRNQLRENDASFNVVKNRLAKLATNGTDASEALDEHLVGPTALTFVQGDAVVAAKTIADFIKANKVLDYKGGLMDGMALGPDAVQRDRPPARRRRPARPARRPRGEPADRRRPDAEPADRRPRLAARPGRRAGSGQRRGPGRRGGRRGEAPAAEAEPSRGRRRCRRRHDFRDRH